MPKVSVIIPVYNAEKYLQECIESVMNQTLQDIEIICVDDGSTDKSLEILKTYEKKDKRIKVLTQKNQFAGIARNYGMDHAQGEYYAFLDSDDYYLESAIENLYNKAIQYNLDMVKGSFYRLESINNEVSTSKYSCNKCVPYELRNKVLKFIDAPEELIYVADVPWNGLYRRAFLDEKKIRFNNLRCVNDHSFFVNCLIYAERVMVVDEFIVYYRIGQSNSLIGTKAKYYNNQLESYRIVKNLCKPLTMNLQQIILEREFDAVLGWYKKICEASIDSQKINLQLENFIEKDFCENDVRPNFLGKFQYKEIYYSFCKPKDDESPKVSIIIPIYNAAPYLKECLSSVVKQTLKDIEIICIDDASTDSSLKIIYDFADRDERIRVIVHSENKHQGGARNSGLSLAKGKYIWFIDADDYIDLDAIEILYNKIEELQDVDVLCFSASAFTEISGKGRSAYPAKAISHDWPTEQKISLPEQQNIIPSTLDGSSVVYISKRKFIEKFRYREHVYFEDADFSFNVFTSNAKFYFMENYYPYHRRVTETSTTGKYADEQKAETTTSRILALKAISTIINEKELPEDHYGVQWFKRWAKYSINVYLPLEKIHEEKFNEIVRYLQFVYDLFPEKTREEYKNVFASDFDITLLCKTNVEYKRLYENLVKKHNKMENNYQKQLEDVHNSISFRLGRCITWFPRKIRGGIRCYKEHGLEYTIKRCFQKIEKILKIESKTKKIKKEKNKIFNVWGLNKIERSPRIIVSLTSYPGRIHTVHKTIDTLLSQTMKPDKVILWLATEQFPEQEKELPKELLRLKKRGLTIEWCEDLKSYKKLIPTLKKYPEDIIVTSDDDAYYADNWLELLYKSYKKESGLFVHCHRITKVYFENGKYHVIPAGSSKFSQPSFLHKLTGLGGVLYPPHSLYEDVLNEKLFQKLAPTNDDLWFWFMAILNGVKIKTVEGCIPVPKSVEGSQENGGLCRVNDQGPKLFWKDFAALMEHYPQIDEMLKRENNLMLLVEKAEKIPSELKKQNYYLNATELFYEAELLIWYYQKTRQYLNLEKPQTYNEKIQWMKLYDSTSLKTRLADKYLVRDWVKEKIGEKYLVPLLGVWDCFDEIDFNKLPNSFVLKANHGCGWNIIVKDKKDFDIDDARKKFNVWMQMNFAFEFGLELHYMNIQPKIIAEEYLENGNNDLYDYKVFCFNGKAKNIMYLSERKQGLKMAFFDLKWDKQSFVYSFPRNEAIIPKPQNLELLIELSEKLAKGFPHVRVDFYILNDGSLKFGEMTFSSASGTCQWNPPEQNKIFGELIELTEKGTLPMQNTEIC